MGKVYVLVQECRSEELLYASGQGCKSGTGYK